ncbi:peptidase A2 [Gordoniibacillus kamchatkensis]|uniref:Peptidase A2 n=1 Tax=Gordoniibacillus kamchatkensis TaxID=1590651 RepID=A0ABR5ALG2_9BACL|nr:trypsin-like peptidase domain-containing protein [Paenibacillus sp. VKM B-2647]KIL41879.1 peptidase A2 [Paenibacillus sp. VKM B-2647]
MNDENNKRDYSDFFKPQSEGEAHESEARERQQAAESKAGGAEDKPSYYYSYGPYKSSASERSAGAESTSYTSTTNGNSGSVEVTPPRPVRSFGYTDAGGQQSGFGGGWQPPKSPRSSLKSVFSAFLAGALVVGSLMFASDKMNLFTGGTHPLASSAPAQTTSAGGGGSPKTAALDIERPGSVSAIFKQASPAVVKVETLVKPKASSRNNPFMNDPFFRQFFGDMFGDDGSSQQQPNQNQNGLQPNGLGTGFIFEKSGYILTNEHVVDGADQINVYVQGYDKPFTAKLLGSSYDLDLAALKIEGDKDFPTLPIGNSDDMQIGDWVVAIGNPYDFDYTVTVGVLSAKERPISIPDQKGTRNYKHLFQTDAAINPGNSGGPLLNMNGEVIGINTAVSAQAQGIGFAIPTSTVSSVLNNLKNNIKIPKEPAPYIGVSVTDIPKDYVSDLKLDNTDGALVMDVPRKTPAFAAGIRQYDVITAINGQKVTGKDDLTKKVQAAKVGDKLTLTIVRNGQKQDIVVTVGDRNQNSDLNQQQ